MNITELTFIQIEQHNLNTFKNLAQAYEAEFSNLTHKLPNELGLFEIDTLPCKPYIGYLLYYQKKPVGFCIADIESEIKDVAEFYIIPVMRKKNLGYQLASMIFDTYPGRWQVRQIEGAIDAIKFWQSVIRKYTQNQYEESVVDDAHWGIVTCQRFQAISKEK